MIQPDSRTTTRRGVLLGAGALGAGAALVACGGSKTAEAPPAETATAAKTTGETTAAAAEVTAKVADVPVGGGLILKDAAVVITQPAAGQFHAFSAVCSHKQCTVNKIADGTVDCPCHNSRFSITDGSVVAGPAEEPLAVKTVTVAGDVLTVS